MTGRTRAHAAGMAIAIALGLASTALQAGGGERMAQADGGTARSGGKAMGPVVILGASYARGWELTRVAGREVINRGISGQQSFQLLDRFEQDVVATRPSAVILWGFINDIFRTRREEIDKAKARARESFEKMIALARVRGVEPILATEVTVRPQDTWSELFGSWAGWALGKRSYQDWVNLQVLEMNQWIRELAMRERVLLLDLQPVVSEPDGQRRKEFAREDGSHIAAAGYAALSAYATPLLERHFAR